MKTCVISLAEVNRLWEKGKSTHWLELEVSLRALTRSWNSWHELKSWW